MTARARMVRVVRAAPPRRTGGYARSLPGQERDPIVVVPVGTCYATFSVGPAVVMWGYAALTAPTATLYATAHEATGENAAALVGPSVTLGAYGGANAALTSPVPTLSVTATVTNLGAAALAAPAPTISAGATVTTLASAGLTFGNGVSTYRIVGYSGAVIAATIGGATVAASGTSGSIGGATLTLPLFEVTASGTVNGLSSAELVCPSAGLAGVGVAWIVAPSATLVAIGTATVTATYEAYAVNLNHAPGPNSSEVDEMTRYTNFPFDRIVRYQNSYFGVAADGLYLLEGTTDYADPTPAKIRWTFRTGISDMKVAQTKTVESVYFGGRLESATVSLYAGESSPRTYRYTGPTSYTAQNYRQVFGRGIRARYFAIGATGTGAMELDDMEFSVGKHTRRI